MREKLSRTRGRMLAEPRRRLLCELLMHPVSHWGGIEGFSHQNNSGTASEKTSDTSLSLSIVGTVEAGNLLVLAVAIDNITAADGDNSEIFSVSDSQGNTWTRAAENTNGNAGAGSGATVSVWYSKLTTQLRASAGDTISVTLASARTAKAASVHEFRCGGVVSVAGSTSGEGTLSDPASLSLSGLEGREYLFFRAIASEEDKADGDISSKTSGFTKITEASSTNAGGNASDMTVTGEFIITTGTGKTSAPTLSANCRSASVFIAFKNEAA